MMVCKRFVLLLCILLAALRYAVAQADAHPRHPPIQ